MGFRDDRILLAQGDEYLSEAEAEMFVSALKAGFESMAKAMGSYIALQELNAALQNQY